MARQNAVRAILAASRQAAVRMTVGRTIALSGPGDHSTDGDGSPRGEVGAVQADGTIIGYARFDIDTFDNGLFGP